MSGQKKLNRATRNIRVVAMPSRKAERAVTDERGNVVLDKSGHEVKEVVQLYRIKPLH